MSEVTEKVVREKIEDKDFVVCWMQNNGDVRKIAEVLDRTEQSVSSRGKKFIKAGVKLCPENRTRKPRTKIIDRVDDLNALLDSLNV
jgi:predicted transcriptional regulator